MRRRTIHRLGLSLACVLLWASSAQAAITVVQCAATGGGGTGATSQNLAFGSNVTAGNSILVGTKVGVAGRTITVTDSLANTYGGSPGTTGDVTQVQAIEGLQTYLHSAHNIAGGANTVTVAISGGNSEIRLNVCEVHFDGVPSLDRTAGAEANASTAVSIGPTSATTIANELVVCAVSHDRASAYTAGGSYTEQGNSPAADGGLAFMSTLIVSATGAQTCTGTLGTGGYWAGVVATYGVTASAVATPRLTLLGVGPPQ